MSDTQEIILIGGGGHCKSCIDVIEAENRFKIVGIIDIKEKLHQKIFEYEIIACDDDLSDLMREYEYVFLTLGHIKSAQKRIEKFKVLKQLGATFPVIISPLAYVSPHAQIHEGTIVMHHAFVNVSAFIGRNCIVNSGAIIEHDAYIGDHCHISTRTVVNGEVRVGERSFVGSNSVIKNTMSIVPDTIIGAGSVVIKPIDEAGTYGGNPAKRIA
jgi:sugar O-acyltransferase (sialic acid O-acetyltransferase NeuD family)